MNTFTTKDGTSIYYKDWGTGPVDHLLARMAFEFRCLGRANAVSRDSEAIVSSPMIVEATDARARPGKATTWINMPTILPS